MQRTFASLALVFALSLVLSACGDDGDPISPNDATGDISLVPEDLAKGFDLPVQDDLPGQSDLPGVPEDLAAEDDLPGQSDLPGVPEDLAAEDDVPGQADLPGFPEDGAGDLSADALPSDLAPGADLEQTDIQQADICSGSEDNETSCDDGVDSDCDGLVDCDDPDCKGTELCPIETVCDNELDDDGDELSDCSDPDCFGPNCQEICGDGADNDADGLIDCFDDDCSDDLAVCGTEWCADGIDNDADGKTDCADEDCAEVFPCGSEICQDGLDNDSDGLVDCDDSEDCPVTEWPCNGETNVITSQGGEVILGNVIIQASEGILEENLALTAIPAEETPPNDAIVGDPMDIQPSGQGLPGAITLTLSYDEGDLNQAAEEDLVLVELIDGSWVVVATSAVDTENNTVSASVDHLGTFAIVPVTADDLLIPPILVEVTSDTEYLAVDTAQAVGLAWAYRWEPLPADSCTVDPGGASVTNGGTVDLTISELTQFTLTCQNDVGSTSWTFEEKPAVAPSLKRFRASPPFALPDQELNVTWSWAYQEEPHPAPVCTIDNGVGEVVSGDVRPVTVNLLPPVRVFTLTCENIAGSDTKNIPIGTVVNAFPEITLRPEGFNFSIGNLFEIDVPEGAVDQDTVVTAEFTHDFEPTPGLLTLPIKFMPEGFVFHKPIRISIAYPQDLLENFGITEELIENLRISWVNVDGQWETLYAEADPENHTISTRISHFSGGSISINDSDIPDSQAQPLTKKRVTLVKRQEVAFVMPGAKYATRQLSDIWDDDTHWSGSGGKPSLGGLGSNLCQGLNGAKYIDAASGDWDNDGADEIAVLCSYRAVVGPIIYRQLKLFLLDDKGNNFRELRVIDTSSLPQSRALNGIESYYDGDLAIGDFTSSHDGLEIILVGSFGYLGPADVISSNYKRGFNYWVLNPESAEVYRSAGGDNGTSGTVQDTRVAAGNIDGGDLDEYVLTGVMSAPGMPATAWAIAENAQGRTVKSYASSALLSSSGKNMNVDVADYDMDGLDEVVLGGIYGSGGHVRFEVYDDTKHNSGNQIASRVFDRFSHSGGVPIQLKFGNFGTHYPPPGQGPDRKGIAWAAYRSTGWTVGYAFFVEAGAYDLTRDLRDVSIATGDLDSDAKDDILYVYRSGRYYQKRHYKRRTTGDLMSFEMVGASYSSEATSESVMLAPLIVTADVDGDSIRLEWTGECSYNFIDGDPNTMGSDPQIIAVLNAPPLIGDLVDQDLQDSGNSGTEFGRSSNYGTETEKTVGVSEGVTLSVEAGDPFGIVTVEASASLTREFERTNTQTQSRTSGVTFSVGYPRQGVIYIRTVYKSCRYRIIGHPEADFMPRSNGDGTFTYKHMTIDQPARRDTYDCQLDEFNDQILRPGLARVDVFDGIMVGDPGTYNGTADRDSLLRSYKGWREPSSGSITVGSASTTTASLELSEESSSSMAVSLEAEFSVGAKVGGFGASYSRGYSSTEAYSVVVGKSTEYAGSVGPVECQGCFSGGACCNGESYSQYRWGMFVYNHNPRGRMPYQVIDYWVEGW